MLANNLLSIDPYEICSIRPPTENSSLTFRLAKNCYWNKCAFCPVYKTGAKFSRRTIGDVLNDITNAKRIFNLLNEHIFMNNPFGRDDAALYSLITAIKHAHIKYGKIKSLHEKSNDLEEDPSIDERMKWFLTWFKDKPTIEDSLTHIYSWVLSGGKTCFLGDSDALIFTPEFISRVTDAIRTSFPSINRITVYGRTKTAARLRTADELKQFAEAGINRIHFGMESGSDQVLSLVNKGVTSAEHIEAALKVRAAGISCSVYVMPGLGGMELSVKHGQDTAATLTAMNPDFIRLRTLEIFPGTGLQKLTAAGTFTEATEEQVIREIRTMILDIGCETEIVSDSATNLLEVNGRLPRDRKSMLEQIDSYLSLGSREKLEFSLNSRIQSFMGQYGGLSGEIFSMIQKGISGSTLDASVFSDDELVSITKMVRGRLMP
ncbi:MAG TPA: radical SAM protein [Spirochaetota bacterium]|nr:radical SAM protein [Spirochaetota bacterium]